MIKHLALHNFTVFKDADLQFSPGLNVIIGENGTGKTHLLKIAYLLSNAWSNLSKEPNGSKDRLENYLINPVIQETAISLRQTRKIKVPDAVIAATALYMDLPLVTRNLDYFQCIKGLELINPLQEVPL